MPALVPVLTDTSMAQPLYVIEEHLAALIDTADLVTPAEEQNFREEFERALTRAVEKRDRVGEFMAHLEDQIAFATQEIERLRIRKNTYQRAFERIEEYVTHTIRTLGRDAKGKFRKLEGKTITFSLANCPPSVEVTDESLVPVLYKFLTLKLSAASWAKVLELLDPDQRAALSREARCQEVTVDKRLVKAAITGGSDVPGADLVTGKTWLKRA